MPTIKYPSRPLKDCQSGPTRCDPWAVPGGSMVEQSPKDPENNESGGARSVVIARIRAASTPAPAPKGWSCRFSTALLDAFQDWLLDSTLCVRACVRVYVCVCGWVGVATTKSVGTLTYISVGVRYPCRLRSRCTFCVTELISLPLRCSLWHDPTFEVDGHCTIHWLPWTLPAQSWYVEPEPLVASLVSLAGDIQALPPQSSRFAVFEEFLQWPKLPENKTKRRCRWIPFLIIAPDLTPGRVAGLAAWK